MPTSVAPATTTVDDPSCLLRPRYDCRKGVLVAAQACTMTSEGPRSLVLQTAEALHAPDLKAACTCIGGWNRKGHPITLTINAWLDVLCDSGFPRDLGSLLMECGLEPCQLEFNILMDQCEISDSDALALRHLRQSGVRFVTSAASPVGTHQAWMRRLPLDGLEVPARLVQDVTADPEGVAIIRALVTRAHRMQLVVNAKGIRSAHTLAVMKACGCDLAQGPLLGAPCTPATFESLLTSPSPQLNLLQAPSSPARTLLLVDDEENILSSLRRLLRRDGYTLLTASSGQEGLEVLAANPVDVILSDQRMPGMTGVEFLRKAKDMHPESVRLVLSGYTDLQSVTDAINEGAIYKFLTKPWDDAMLRANIEEAFRRKALSDENLRLATELRDANQELAEMNERLRSMLADGERRLGMEERALGLAHEALAGMPVPVLGVDADGMVALSNRAADRLFADKSPLLGQFADDVLPPPIIALIAVGTGGDDIVLGDHCYHVEARPLHGAPRPGNCLLTFTCCKPAHA